MREQQEAKATGYGENEKESVENRLFLISVREVICMLVGRRSNEESSVLRLQSELSITSWSIVGLEMVE